MPKYTVLVAQFPGNNSSHPRTNSWVARLFATLCMDPEIGPENVGDWWKATTPVTMARNQCMLFAEREKYDYVLMVDSDMAPDDAGDIGQNVKPFWDSTWEFMKNHQGPCVVAAPYCGPPPIENVLVFRYRNSESDASSPNFQLDQYSREEAAAMQGIQRAAALATGLMMIDMRAIRKMNHPRFYYTYTDETQSILSGTEDVTFSRDLHIMGIPIYCNWDAWAGHMKQKQVLKPKPLGIDCIPKQIRHRAKHFDASGYADEPKVNEVIVDMETGETVSGNMPNPFVKQDDAAVRPSSETISLIT